MTVTIPDPRYGRWQRLIGPAESRARAFALAAGAAGLVLVGSFLNFLNFNGYSVWKPEVAAVGAMLCAFALLIGFIGALLGTFGRVFISLALVILAIDLNFDSQFPMLIGLAIWPVTIRFLRQALILLFAVVLLTGLGSALFGPGDRRPSADALPARMPATADFALVHIILDEHIGVEGLPDSVPGAEALRAQLKEYYMGQGFRVFGGAYSESLRTMHAVPHLMALDRPEPWRARGRQGTTMTGNRYFDALQAMGLQVEVAQTDWIDYCQHPAVTSCSKRSAGRMVDVGAALPIADKAILLIYRFGALSSVGRRFAHNYDRIAVTARRNGHDLPLVDVLRTDTSALIGMATLQDTIAAARSLEPGRAMFSHVLLPHSPYVYDAQCRLRPISLWLGNQSPDMWERRYAAYFEQIKCGMTQIEAVLDAIAQSPAAGKTVIIIHADHGSRIMRTPVSVATDGKYTDRDLVDGYVAFFAVSAPGIDAGYDVGRYPVRYLLTALIESHFQSATPTLPAGFEPTVAVEARDWTPAYELSVRDSPWWSAAPGHHD